MAATFLGLLYSFWAEACLQQFLEGRADWIAWRFQNPKLLYAPDKGSATPLYQAGLYEQPFFS